MQTVSRSGSSFAVIMAAILLAVMLIIIALFMLFEQQSFEWINSVTQSLSSEEGFVLLALFLIAALACDIVLPIPSSIVAVVAASTLGMWLGAGVIWLGLMLSCIAGYMIGAGSGYLAFRSLVDAKDMARARTLATKVGSGALVVMRGVPVLAETSVIAAGLVSYPFVRFIIICALSNAGLALAYGYVGAKAAAENSFLYVVLASILVPAAAWGVKWAWQRATHSSSASEQINDSYAAQLDNRIDVQFNIPQHYPVIFENQVFARDNQTIRDFICQNSHGRPKVMVFVDSGVVDANPELVSQIIQYFDHYQNKLQLAAEPFVVQGGEAGKHYGQVEVMYQQMLDNQLDRHSFVIVIGGGAVLDVVGFACATFHRGIKLLRMPSTVLAQNDAGVGVKNGFNWANTKNLIGAFTPPSAVINDAALLETLSARDKRAGLAEAVKVAAIRDSDFFAWMEQQVKQLCEFESQASQYAITRCAQLHLKQISQAGDPFETGSARPLDYGHWSAHKLEAISDYQLRHGEAVAIGMALDAQYAVNIGMLSQKHGLRLVELLEGLGFELWHPALEQLDDQGEPKVFKGLEEFRQHLGGQLCVTLLKKLGVGREVDVIHLNQMKLALDWLQKRALQRTQSTE